MKKIIRLTAALALLGAFALPGVVAAERSRDDDHSKNGSSQQTEVENETKVMLENETQQAAITGSVEISSGDHNGGPKVLESRYDGHRDRHHHDDTTSVNGVTTGSASNENSTSATVEVANETSVATAPAPVVSRSHHSSSNGSEVNVENETCIGISNSTSQETVSGSVSINGASEVGNITTGDASNSNTTELMVSVSSQTDV